MKIISSRPVLNNQEVISPGINPTDEQKHFDVDYNNFCNADADSDYSNVKGKGKKKKEVIGTSAPKQKGAFGKKVGSVLDKAKQSGLTDSVKVIGQGFIDKKLGRTSIDTTTNDQTTDTGSGSSSDVPKSPMSKTTKIIIGVGAGLVVIGGLYFMLRKIH